MSCSYAHSSHWWSQELYMGSKAIVWLREPFEPAESFSLTFRVGVVPWWTVCPLLNCHYFTNSSKFTSFKCVTRSHQLHNCSALQPITTNGFPCIRVKGKLVYFTFWSFSSSLSSFSLIINVLQSGLYEDFHCTLIRQWYVSESPYLCLFTEKLAQGLAHGGQRDAVCPFPLKGDRNVGWFSGTENGSISSHQVLLVWIFIP